MARPNIELLFRLILAVIGGVLSSLAMPREGIWPLIFVSVAALVLSVRGLRFGKALLVGFVGGAAFYLSQIEWLSLYLGPVPWLALSILEAAIFAAGMAAIARVGSWVSAFRINTWARTVLSATLIGLIWTSREWVSINVPYGGFPWSRLAQTQSDSPLATWVSLVGFSGLSFVVAIIGAALAEFIVTVRKNDQFLTRAALAALVALISIPAFAITPSAEAESGYLTVAGVQGNANAGLFANPERGSILKNHLDASNLIAKSDLADQIDLVVWPENASDLSPFIDANANSTITSFVNNLKVPLVFGTVTARGDQIFNSSIFWQPEVGPTDFYDKKRPVPFAEYIPDRDFWYQLAPDLVGLVTRGYSFGERDGIFELPTKAGLKANKAVGGSTKLGVLICFEIAIDDIGRDLSNQGAKVILSQTNNADFGYSDETFQQAALAKLRSIETGRAVVNVSTVGVSAIYLPNGQVVDQLPTFEPGAMVAEVPLRTTQTLATLIGPWFDLTVNLLALLSVAAAYRSAWPPARRARI